MGRKVLFWGLGENFGAKAEPRRLRHLGLYNVEFEKASTDFPANHTTRLYNTLHLYLLTSLHRLFVVLRVDHA